MAWGDYVQHTTNGYSNRTVANSFEDITLTGVKKNNVVILLLASRQGAGIIATVTAADGSGSIPVHGFGVGGSTDPDSISRGYLRAWYIAPSDVEAGSITMRIAWTGAGSAPGRSDIGLFELSADAETSLEMTGSLTYSEDPVVVAPQFTQSKESFSFFAGSQIYDNGFWASAAGMHDTHIADMGGGTISGTKIFASVFSGSFDTWTFMHESINMSNAAGATVDGDGLMLIFSRGNHHMDVPPDTVLSANTLYRISSASFGQVSGSTTTATLSFAGRAHLAGDLLVFVVTNNGGGAYTSDPAVSQGWTLLADLGDGSLAYYKVTAGSEASLTWTWTTSTRPGYAFACYRLGGSLISVSSGATSVVGGFAASDTLTTLSRENAGRRLWILCMDSGNVVGAVDADTNNLLPARTWAQGAGASPSNKQIEINAAVIDGSGYPEAAGCVYESTQAALSDLDGALTMSAAFFSWGVETDPLPGDGAGPLYVRRHVGAQAVPYTLRRSDLEDVPWHEAYPQARATLPGRSERSAPALQKS